MNPLGRWLLGWMLLLGLAPGLWAHGMHVEARVDAQGAVVGRALYGRHAVAQATVQVLDPGGRVLAEGRTDAQGAFTVRIQPTSDVQVVVTEGAHRGVQLLPRSAFPSAAPAGGAPEPAGLAAVVEAAVARRLEPVELALQRQADVMRFRDILGGIGYILGLAGIACYMAARNRPRS